jgi:hypothetical protein
MARVLMLLCAAVVALAGCATQKRPAQVGETGYNPREERLIIAEEEAKDYYDYKTPKTGAVIRSNPAGALVEWYNDDGIWVSVGTTPTLDIVIEATGKPELFRVSAPGYLPQIRWVASTPGSESVEVSFELERELPDHRYYIGD